mmetsp:Transcript_7467/g.8432  ORF Transcript_7467/g.8432 Transcript_7467/m.8432 type:complete len:143 (-) Transcript_7467:40-468(-)
MSLTDEGILDTKRELMANNKFNLYNIVDFQPMSENRFGGFINPFKFIELPAFTKRLTHREPRKKWPVMSNFIRESVPLSAEARCSMDAMNLRMENTVNSKREKFSVILGDHFSKIKRGRATIKKQIELMKDDRVLGTNVLWI